jgi:8-oxo-dGDP phosphatase
MLIVALALVEVDGRILLIQEAKPACLGTWFLPGGRMDPGESLTECVRREVREEAGLDVEPLGLLYVDQMLGEETGQ